MYMEKLSTIFWWAKDEWLRVKDQWLMDEVQW